MSGVDDAVRDLCRQIAQEKEPENVHQLLVALRTALKEGHLKEEQEEARLRMSQIARRSPPHLRARAGVTRNRTPRFHGLRGLLETGLGLL